MMRRFVDKNLGLYAYMDEVAVYCHRCSKPGMVHANRERYCFYKARFSCKHCALSLDSERDQWIGPVVYEGRAPCGFCGYQWVWARQRFEHPPASVLETLAGQCPECSHSTQVRVYAQRERAMELGIDPHFGLPLRLAQPTRLGTVWVYNMRQLMDLRAYVAATLREGVTVNGSYFSRLPTWIKQARNRRLVLSALAKLQDKWLKGE